MIMNTYLTIVTLITLAMVGLPRPVMAVPFAKDVEATLAAERDRPAVLVFGAEWCGWCRKMESVTLLDEQVQQMADDFVWIEIDIDDNDELAARYGVRGVPETIILNEDGGVIGSESGYLPPEQFAEFLRQTLESPQEVRVPIPLLIERFLAAEGESLADETVAMVDSLALPDRAGRPAILDAFKTKGPATADVLVELLVNEHVAIRAAASTALSQATGANVSFNAFTSPADRELQAQAWTDWLALHSTAEIEELETPP